MQPPAAQSALAGKVGAKEFVPAPPGLSSGSLPKSPSGASLRKAGSSSSLSAAALNAPVFVPGATGEAAGGDRGRPTEHARAAARLRPPALTPTAALSAFACRTPARPGASGRRQPPGGGRRQAVCARRRRRQQRATGPAAHRRQATQRWACRTAVSNASASAVV